MYQPKPLDTANVTIPDSLAPVLERLAEHIHDVWAAGRIQEGWTWGPRRDDVARQHPNLVPYAELSEAEKEYDRATTAETLRAVLKLGYTLQRVAH